MEADVSSGYMDVATNIEPKWLRSGATRRGKLAKVIRDTGVSTISLRTFVTKEDPPQNATCETLMNDRLKYKNHTLREH